MLTGATNAYTLGSLLRTERERQGRTQAELARLAGISRQLLVHIEKGHPRAELARVLAVVKALGSGMAL